MSTYKKADHRLVQPRPEHYIQRTREDGTVEDVLVGPYSIEQRNKFFKIEMSLYFTRHKDALPKKAKQKVFQKWRNLVFATIGDEYIPAKDSEDVRDAINILKEVTS